MSTPSPSVNLDDFFTHLTNLSPAQVQFISETLHKIGEQLAAQFKLIVNMTLIIQQSGLTSERQKECLHAISESGQISLSFLNHLVEKAKHAATPPNQTSSAEAITTSSTPAKSAKKTQSQVFTELAKIPTLLVDDDPEHRKYLQKLLKRLGLDCTTTTTEEALLKLHTLAQRSPYQITVISASHYGHHIAYLGRTIRASAPLNHVMTTLALPNELMDFEKDRAHFDGFACLLNLSKPERLASNLASSWRGWAAKINFTHTEASPTQNAILLVEDDPIPQKVVAWQLNQLGYIVDTAMDGGTALKLLEQRRYDLIFMDIGLPDISGLEVTAEIRKRETGGRHTPIIGLTIYAMSTDQKTGLQVGMDEYLAKPLSPERLHEVLNKWVPVKR